MKSSVRTIIHNCDIYGSIESGITLFGSSQGSIVSSNSIRKSVTSGIFSSEGSTLSVFSGNYIAGNNVGIIITNNKNNYGAASENNIIIRNTIVRNLGKSILLEADNNTIGCIVEGTMISSNTMLNNGHGVTFIGKGVYSTFYYSNDDRDGLTASFMNSNVAVASIAKNPFSFITSYFDPLDRGLIKSGHRS